MNTNPAFLLRPTAWLLGAALATLSACATLAPTYERPSAAAPAVFKEAPAADSTWFPAAPADTLDRGPWWQLFGDPILSKLVEQVEVSNQNVAAAVAAYAQAQALVRQERAALFPSLAINASATRSGGAASLAQPTNLQLGLGASWEPDIWGQLRLAVTSAQASAQASAANLAAARLSAQAALATDYFALREADNEIALLTAAVSAYERSLRITQNQYDAAIAQRTDVLQAQTQLETTRANLTAMVGQRALLEHAIALLVGKAPADFSVAPAPWNANVPALPLVVPSALLQRRPDIAAAERRAAAANAQIGIAVSAFYPNISLGGSGGFESLHAGTWIQGPSALWSLGAQAAQLLFDAGQRRALTSEARHSYEAQVAGYKNTVILAFNDVEDQLSSLRILEQETGVEQKAVASAQHSFEISNRRYKGGVTSYLEVLTAEQALLQNQRTAIDLQTRQFAASVALVRSLGGGWDATQLPK
jgi:NodT family efflux transporter outer membrane factor (OMF) lipoprotein